MPCTCKKERACIGIACCSIPLICICEENMFKNFEEKKTLPQYGIYKKQNTGTKRNKSISSAHNILPN
jgi:hypothetical protein